MAESQVIQPKIVFFGHFGGGNFGNEATFQAMLWNLRRFVPGAQLLCVTTYPEKVVEDYGIAAIPISGVVVKPWTTHNPLARLARKLFVGIPSELYRWFKAIATLWHAQMFVVVGTGLLTDAFCLGSWGPYSVFKWTVAAKLCRCKIVFVSAGAGPLDRPIGRLLIKSALSLADFRSYRDEATLSYLQRIGFRTAGDAVYPDLAFSLPLVASPRSTARNDHRPVVGLGLMEFGGMYGVEKTSRANFDAYLQILVEFVKWLMGRGYDIRLLIGDLSDQPTVEHFRSQLQQHLVPEDRIIAEPVTSTGNLLSQMAATDFIVATRFHNVLLGLFLDKPTISISFHHKCSSLMDQMGLSEYCQDIQKLALDKLIGQFCSLEENAVALAGKIRRNAESCRSALDRQYRVIFQNLLGGTAEEIAPATGSRHELKQILAGRDKP